MMIEHPTHAVYGEHWLALSADERGLLIEDILDTGRELSADYMTAAREHCRRLGGPGNLRGYVACLVAGEARRKREASGQYYAARFSEMWGPARWAVFAPSGVRVREFPDDSRESGLAANMLAEDMSKASNGSK